MKDDGTLDGDAMDSEAGVGSMAGYRIAGLRYKKPNYIGQSFATTNEAYDLDHVHDYQESKASSMFSIDRNRHLQSAKKQGNSNSYSQNSDWQAAPRPKQTGSIDSAVQSAFSTSQLSA